jgi:hypothetical protein
MNSATREYARLPSPRHRFHAYIISRGFPFDSVWVAGEVRFLQRRNGEIQNTNSNHCLGHYTIFIFWWLFKVLRCTLGIRLGHFR